jgi:restriction system protein
MHTDFSQTFLKGILNALSQLWFIWLILGLVLIGKIVLYLLEKQKLAKSGIADIDSMDGKIFEKYLEVLFERLGYKVERIRYIGDYGADLVTQKNGVKTVIQAKRHKNNVGIKAIQEAVAAKGYYNCDKAMVITNSYFTSQAKELAVKNGVDLWDRKDLVKNLLKIKEEGEIKITQTSPEAISNDSSDTCVICGMTVSEKVHQYCLDHPEKFGGKIYCYEHQRKS